MNSSFNRDELFSLGELRISVLARNKLTIEEIVRGLSRHAQGDCGQLSSPDRGDIEKTTKAGGIVLSLYSTEKGQHFWVATYGTTPVTTVGLLF